MKHRSTYATVIGASLLLASIAGVATATAPERDARGKAPHIKKNSVASVHIKNGTIRAKDLSPKVRAAIAATPTPTPAPVPEPAPAPYTPPKVHAAAPENSVNVPSNSDTEVVSKVLPAGTYAVQANLTLYTIQSGIGSCTLLVDSDSYNLAQHNFAAGGGRTSIALSSVVSVASAKPVSIECWTPATGNASEIRLTAIQVTQ
ncbi:hypothetical protein [Nocardioides endophyticus]